MLGWCAVLLVLCIQTECSEETQACKPPSPAPSCLLLTPFLLALLTLTVTAPERAKEAALVVKALYDKDLASEDVILAWAGEQPLRDCLAALSTASPAAQAACSFHQHPLSGCALCPLLFLRCMLYVCSRKQARRRNDPDPVMIHLFVFLTHTPHDLLCLCFCRQA